MKFGHTYLILLFILPFVYGCNPQPEAKKLLLQAETMADKDQVDSASKLVDSIFYPEKSFDKENYMQYLVTRVRVRYKAYQDIKSDTAIFEARKYFKQKASEPRWMALATFYSGCVYREQGRKEFAMEAYSEAAGYAEKTTDNDLKGLVQNNIGGLFHEQTLYRQALSAYYKSNALYANLPLKRIQSYSCIGAAYVGMGNLDSAQMAFQNGLQLAQKIKDRAGESTLLQNISVTYSEHKEYDKSLSCLKRSFYLNRKTAEIPRYYLNIFDLYSKMGISDSAEWYARLVKEKVADLKDYRLQLSMYNSLASLANNKGNYKEEADWRVKELNTYGQILNQNDNQSVLDAYRKYNFERMKNRTQQTLNTYLFVAILLLLIIILGGAVFIWSSRREQRLRKTVQDKINTMSQLALQTKLVHQQQLVQNETSLREQLLWKFDVIRKSTLLLEDGMENLNSSYLLKEFKRIVYQNNEVDIWQTLMSLIDSLENGLSERIRTRFPDFSEKEFRICLLTYSGLNSKEIALVLGLTRRSVQTIRTELRKKIGLDDIHIDTDIFLRELIS